MSAATVLTLVSLGALGAGSALILAEAPWFGRRPLTDRLRPYAPAAPGGAGTRRATSTAGAVLEPVLGGLGRRLARLGGRGEALSARLARAGEAVSPASFRLRQLAHAAVGLAAGSVLALLIGPGTLMGPVLVLGAPALCVLLDEHRLERRGELRTQRIRLELPVVAEQLGILIAAGYSLPSALARIGRRGNGIVAGDLAEVGRRIRQGVGEAEALDEWARRTDVAGVRRLVGILALHREAGDLGRLIADEARTVRAETHRELVATIERRGQLVWIPVTLATLVPGLLFLAVPFVSAITQVTGG
jgi:pilus assembly protein TadC